jgi:hypothetical protein
LAKTYNLPDQPVFKIAEKLDSVFDKEWSKVTKSLAKIQERSGGGPTGIKLSFNAPKVAEATSSPAPAPAPPKVSLKLRTSLSARPTADQASLAPASVPAARPILKLKAKRDGEASTTTKKLKINGNKKDRESTTTIAAPSPVAPVIPPLPDTPLIDLRQYASEAVNNKKAKAVLKQMNQSEYSYFFRAPVDAASAPGCVAPPFGCFTIGFSFSWTVTAQVL